MGQRFKAIVTVACLCSIGLALGTSCSGPINGGETVNLVDNSAVPNTAIPPIDDSAPGKTETATFALG